MHARRRYQGGSSSGEVTAAEVIASPEAVGMRACDSDASCRQRLRDAPMTIINVCTLWDSFNIVHASI